MESVQTVDVSWLHHSQKGKSFGPALSIPSRLLEPLAELRTTYCRGPT